MKYSQLQKKAIKGVIAALEDKWIPLMLLDIIGEEPLCLLCSQYGIPFQIVPTCRQCQGCPIKRDTGKVECLGTPYYQTVGASNRLFPGNKRQQDASRRMLEYLTSLLNRLVSKELVMA